jgi:DegV family protein with EDD domain
MAGGVRVVTDSAAALPREVAEAHGVSVVPLGLSIGGLPVREEALELEELIARFDEGVRTSGPAPGDFAKAVEEAQTGDGVVVITLARDLSSTYRSAMLGSQEAQGPVEVVDSRTAAGAEGLVALAAARAAAEGRALPEVVRAAERTRAAVTLVGALATLDYVVKGGHIPAAAGWAARRLNVQPVIELRDGKVRPHRPAFSREAALERLLEYWRRTTVPDAPLHLVAMHSVGTADAESLLASVRAEASPATSFLSGFGTSLVAHTGPGLVGLAWYWER